MQALIVVLAIILIIGLRLWLISNFEVGTYGKGGIIPMRNLDYETDLFIRKIVAMTPTVIFFLLIVSFPKLITVTSVNRLSAAVIVAMISSLIYIKQFDEWTKTDYFPLKFTYLRLFISFTIFAFEIVYAIALGLVYLDK